MQRKFEKLFLVFKIIALELVARFCLSYERNECYQPSMFQQTVLTFWIWFRDMLSYSVCLRLMEIEDKRWCHADLDSVRDLWTRWPAEGVLKEELFSIELSRFFIVNNFTNIWVIQRIFFYICAKFHEDFKNAIKIWVIAFGFWDNFLWTCCGISSQLW